ncbi:MAG: transcriptional regulator NrdR [Lachnospiraceae bacterium]|nr:transcriptional regulator NrdR [Lachnospiraceae bacterium]
MKCPFCSQDNTRVVDSRPVEESNSIRRRRVCENCGRRFTTYEKVETFPIMVIKKDQTREVYDRAKLEQGILRACHKRPVSSAQISAALNEIETAIYAKEQAEILSTDIGEMVMARLKNLDMVAYVRFASVYREFKDADTFMEELKKLLAEQ